jgi:hypothetical protein
MRRLTISPVDFRHHLAFDGNSKLDIMGILPHI